jgi:hypothetical protein
VQLVAVAAESMADRGSVIEIECVLLVDRGVRDGNRAAPSVSVPRETSGTRTGEVVVGGFEIGLGSYRPRGGELNAE